VWWRRCGLGGLAVMAPLTVLACLPACERDTPASDPAAVVESFVAASRNGDRAAVYQHLGPKTRARLQEALQSAKRVSGRLELRPHDFLSVGQAPPAWEASSYRTTQTGPKTATVSISSAAGDRHDLELVRAGDAWRIELPMR